MNIKRVISSLLGIPVIAIILSINNDYVINVASAFLAAICLYEFYKAFSSKYNPVQWIGYLTTIIIVGLHTFVDGSLFNVLILEIFMSFVLLFLHIFKKKINVIDAAITLMGIFYITIFTMFIPLTKELPKGNFLIWYVFIAAWGTDTFAYLIGKYFGKHKFTEVSPKKTLEGCVGGVIGAVISMLIATYIFNTYCNMNVSYGVIIIFSIALSAMSQIGDLVASSIKRYCNIKDFGNIIPGHGGMLDRFDSVIFAAPVAYFLFSLL